MERGDSIAPLKAAPPGLSPRRKVILSVQAVLTLLIIAAAVWALAGPGKGAPVAISNTSSSAASSGSGPSGASSSSTTSPPKESAVLRTDTSRTSQGIGAGTTEPAQGIPQKLGAVTLIDALTGQKAIDDMSMLHGKDVGLTGGWVGQYQARGTAYVGETVDEEVAAQLLDAMVARIGAGNRVFTGLRSAQVDGQKVYFVTGLGQNHYFYQKGNKVIWLALPTNKPEDFLGDALRLIN
ncbi:MAG: hypothetical protein HYY30_09570 [Chloroflexi bacterium]|nr:hypothetical protein [Chloroflexota bacterium]